MQAVPEQQQVTPACATPVRASLCVPGVMDPTGRVDESRLHACVLRNGGVCPGERAQVWRFLFGVFPCSSTVLERPLLHQELSVRYRAMKLRWRQVLPSAVRLKLNGTDAELVAAVSLYEQHIERETQQDQDHNQDIRDRLSFLELQAQMLLERVTFDVDELQEAVRIIDKDVPRTDRDVKYYLDEGLRNLLVLRDILITFAAFHPDVSYAQGMNDLCSRFLEVLDSEVDTYWSFCCYMEKFSRDFCADGLHRKIELEAELLKDLDPELHTHLVTDTMEKLTFCHRWLLLGFQREFERTDALRLFEILSCDHLELISQRLERHRLKLADDDNVLHTRRHSLLNSDFTFELFVCAAILLEHRDTLLQCQSDAQLIQFASSLQGTLELDSTLQKAERQFYSYCKRSIRRQGAGLRACGRSHQEHLIFQLRSLFS